MYIYNEWVKSWNFPKLVKSGVPERMSISCPTCGIRHDLLQMTGNQSCVTVGEHTLQLSLNTGCPLIGGSFQDSFTVFVE